MRRCEPDWPLGLLLAQQGCKCVGHGGDLSELGGPAFEHLCLGEAVCGGKFGQCPLAVSWRSLRLVLAVAALQQFCLDSARVFLL